MTFPVLFRSYGGENAKGRPEWFSKTVCLLSAIRSAQAAGAHLVFVNNGPIPEDRLAIMRRTGDVETLPGVGVKESYLSALRLATRYGEASDLCWISEDDYLYHPEALGAFAAAAGGIEDADYFALYSNNPVQPRPRPEPPVHRPRGWVDGDTHEVAGRSWERIYSTTATFGARTSALAADLPIFTFCTRPHRNMFRDHDTCLVYQGFEPYSYGHLARSASGRVGTTPRQRLREAAMSPFYLATNLRSHRRAANRRLLVGSVPDLAAHAEDGYVPPGIDWSAVAADTLAWAAGQGLLTGTDTVSGQPDPHESR